MTQYASPHPGQPQYGHHPPVSGFAVPSGTPGYGHIDHPPASGFAGQEQAGYASQMPAGPGAPAGVWMRLLARLIDGLVVGGITALVATPLLFIVFAAGLWLDNADGVTSGGRLTVTSLLLTEAAIVVFMLLVHYVYEVELAKRTGQTVGKKVLKLRVTPLGPNQPLDRGILAKRWLVVGPGGLVPGLSLINVIWCLWDRPYRQCLHDKFAKTVVVKVPA